MKLSLFDIVFNIGLGCLVIVHHLHNLKEVLFLEFLEALGQFFHVELLSTMLEERRFRGKIWGALQRVRSGTSS